MESEDFILKKLILALKDAGVSPLPADEYLSERIGQRLKFFKNPPVGHESEIESDKFTSPVCFMESDEVQSDYRIDQNIFSQIDKCIDRLILKYR